MEERNNILEQVNIRKISDEDKINMEERKTILLYCSHDYLTVSFQII